VSRSESSLGLFPPRPRGLKGRNAELDTLAEAIEAAAPTRLALVGAGGSGKSMLAAALAYRVAPRFGRRMSWFRVGAWDFRTLAEMLALRFGTPRDRHEIIAGLRAYLSDEERLVVLDNHEDDAAMARLLDALAGTKATFLITARRCLLAGVLIFPVTAPLVTSGRAAFPRVAALTRRLRWSPLALDIADSFVASEATTALDLAEFLDERGIGAVRVIDHEDDLPEVALLIEWAWQRLPAESKRMLGVLAHVEGDHVDRESLAKLARVTPAKTREAIAALERWHLVQEAMPDRWAVHAVVRYAVQKRTKPLPPARFFEHYVGLLERHPERILTEQTHLFAAMDQAHRSAELDGMLRVERLLTRLGDGS
jgi:hypothetical protein